LYRILYVDDEPGLLEIGKLFLEQSGYFSVDIITSAPAALALLGEKDYDAIIADYQMPVMDGIGFLKKIRISGNTIPFILFTGRGREEIVIQALNEGADFYLQKGGEPMSQFTELEHKVRQAIQQRRAEASIRDLERQQADIINFLPDATFAIDTSRRVIAWNRAIEEMTGVPADSMLGKGDYEYAIPFYGQRQPILIDLVFSFDETVAGNYTHIIRKKDILIADTAILRVRGKPVTFMVIASPLYDRQGRVVGAIESIRDITERKQADDAIRESEERYRNVVEVQTELISRFLPDGTHVFVNEAYCRYFSLKRDEILGHRFRPEIPAGDRERVRQFFASLHPGQPVNTIEHRIILADGSIRWQRWTDRAIFDPSGTITEYQSVGQDITEAKQAGDAIRESEERYRVLVMHSQDGAFLMQDGICLFCNEAFAAMIGATPSEIIGMPVPDLIAPEDREMVMERQRARLAGKSLPESYEFRMIHRDGMTRVPVILSVGIGTYKKRPAVIGTVRDVTKERERESALRESEEKYRSLVETSFDGILIHQDGSIIYANATTIRLFGAGTAGEIIGKPVLSFVHPQYRSLVFQRMTSATTELQPVIKEKFLRIDGGVIDVDVVAIPFVWKDKPAVHVVFRDITGYKKAEEALRESEAQYRDLFENSVLGIFRTTPEGTFSTVNPTFARIAGYESPGEMLEVIRDVRTQLYVNPSDRTEFMGKLIADGSVRNFKAQFYRRDGCILWIAINAIAVRDREGRVRYFEGTIEDITEQKRAEEALRESEKRFHELSDLLPQGVYEVDTGGNLKYTNRIAFGYFGYTEDDYRQGLNVLQMIAPGDVKRAEASFHAFMEGKEVAGGPAHEYMVLRKDGSTIPVAVYSSPIVVDGRITGLRGIIIDITGDKRVSGTPRKKENSG
jgi:PAS domain S-box-containing protein